MDRGVWWATIHGVAKESDRTWWLNNRHTHTHTQIFGDLLNSLVASENKQRPRWENSERLNYRDMIMLGSLSSVPFGSKESLLNKFFVLKNMILY